MMHDVGLLGKDSYLCDAKKYLQVTFGVPDSKPHLT